MSGRGVLWIAAAHAIEIRHPGDLHGDAIDGAAIVPGAEAARPPLVAVDGVQAVWRERDASKVHHRTDFLQDRGGVGILGGHGHGVEEVARIADVGSNLAVAVGVLVAGLCVVAAAETIVEGIHTGDLVVGRGSRCSPVDGVDLSRDQHRAAMPGDERTGAAG